MALPATWAPHPILALVSLNDDRPMTDDDWRLLGCLHQACTTDLRATRTRSDLTGRGDRNKTFIKLTLWRGNQCASQNATGNMLIDSLLNCFCLFYLPFPSLKMGRIVGKKTPELVSYDLSLRTKYHMIRVWIMLTLNSVCLCVISFNTLFWKNPTPRAFTPGSRVSLGGRVPRSLPWSPRHSRQ